MLFLPEDIYDARARLKLDLDAGKITPEEAFQKMLELDPDDYVAMLELGGLRREAGDFGAAEEYFWRAIQAHPCLSFPYMVLARLLHERPESAAMSEALGELAIAKRALADESFLEGLDFEKAGIRGKALKEFKKLPAAAQGRLIAMSMRENREPEPEAVTERLRQIRILHQLQEEGDLSPETVDSIVGEGESIVPLLVGVLRDWAQDLLGDEGDGWVENALALIGEAGSASEIPHLLQFVDLAHEDAAGAASWALGRILERHSEEAAQCIGSIAAGLGPPERLAVAQQILRHPDFDPAGKMLTRLSEDLGSMAKADRDAFFPLLLTTMAVAGGSGFVKLGRAAFERQRSLLSSSARRTCEELIADFTSTEVPPVPMEPSTVTVYDICAGNVVWGGDEEDDEEQEEDEFPSVPEPVRRQATPGRNDPCWCNSGKKYKKCHLDSDERRDGAALHQAPAVSGRANEFVSLRGRIGDFLGQALSERDMKLGLNQLFGDQVQNKEDANVTATDWMIHDFVGPSLGRTVMQEFLVRSGSRITQREREMVEAWSRSFMGLYEVQELTAGVGIKLKDLIFGETFFVHDVNMSTQLARWDGLLARVVPGERGTELAGIGLTVPRHGIEPLRLWMEQDREEAGLEWREYLKGNWPRVRRQSFEIAANWMESVRLSNTDGEELLFSKAVYALIDPGAAMSALRRCPEFQSEFDKGEREYFVWLNRKQTVLGNIRIERNELVLDCNSRERMERGKLLLSSIAGESLRHLRDEFTTQKELKSRAASASKGAPSLETEIPREAEIPKDIRDQVIANFLEDHYSAWPDTKLPALSGKTPREAARTAKGRKQLIAVLKDIENGEERKRKTGEPSYDVARLRAELGLEY